MKENPTGTTYVPGYCSKERSKKSDLISDLLPEECRIKNVTDFRLFNTIACLCTAFLFPPLIILAAYFLYLAKKQKGGRL